MRDALSRRAIRVAALITACCFSVRAQTNTSPEENVRLSAKGTFLADHAAVGDTIQYSLTVEWRDSRVPVVVLAPESLETPGFRIAGQSASHRKTAENGEIRNATEFLYKLVPKAPGSAKVSPLKVRYITGFSSREEALYVPGAFIEVQPAHVPLWKQLWFQLIGFLLVGVGAVWLGWKNIPFDKLRDRRNAKTPKQRNFAPEVLSLKGRWNTAESKTWIDSAEKICLEFLRHKLGKSGSDPVRFEILLDQYLVRDVDLREAEGWNRLRELFHHARYAGGNKEPHELQETYRTLKTCMHIQGENE